MTSHATPAARPRLGPRRLPPVRRRAGPAVRRPGRPRGRGEAPASRGRPGLRRGHHDRDAGAAMARRDASPASTPPPTMLAAARRPPSPAGSSSPQGDVRDGPSGRTGRRPGQQRRPALGSRARRPVAPVGRRAGARESSPVQVPGNFRAPTHALLTELSRSPRWSARVAALGPQPDAVRILVGPPRRADRCRAGGRRLGDDLPPRAAAAPDPVLGLGAQHRAPPGARRTWTTVRGRGPHQGPLCRRAALLAERPDGTTVLPFRRVFAVGRRTLLGSPSQCSPVCTTCRCRARQAARRRCGAFYGGVLGMTEVAKLPVLAARGGVWFLLWHRRAALRRGGGLPPGPQGAPGSARRRPGRRGRRLRGGRPSGRVGSALSGPPADVRRRSGGQPAGAAAAGVKVSPARDHPPGGGEVALLEFVASPGVRVARPAGRGCRPR